MKSYKNKLNALEIKKNINPQDFYLLEQNLNRYENSSTNWVIAGLCPFHNDKKTGSFKINIETGAFKCWSCGAYGGDIINFIEKRDNLSFLEALEKLSNDWRVI